MTLRVVLAAAAVLIVAGCGTATAEPAPPPDPYLPAAGQIASLQSPADMTLVDGRRIHVTLLQGATTYDSCEITADADLARRLAQGQAVRIARPVTRDAPSAVPAGAVQVDMRLADGSDYATTYADQRWENREQACPTPVPPPLEQAPTSSDSGDVYVHLDGDDGESRFCSRRWYC